MSLAETVVTVSVAIRTLPYAPNRKRLATEPVRVSRPGRRVSSANLRAIGRGCFTMQVALSLCNAVESWQRRVRRRRGTASELLKDEIDGETLVHVAVRSPGNLRHEAVRLERRPERRAGGGDYGGEARHLRRLSGGYFRRRTDGACRHPGGRAIQRGHPAGRQSSGVHDRVPG